MIYLFIFNVTVVQTDWSMGANRNGPTASWDSLRGYSAGDSLQAFLGNVYLTIPATDLDLTNWVNHPICRSGTQIHQDVISADLDNDGDNDIITTHTVDFTGMKFYMNDGYGNFTRQVIIDTMPIQFAWPVDFDYDGDMDVVFSVYGGNYQGLYLLEQEENFRFVVKEILDMLAIKYIRPADFNNDSLMDILFSTDTPTPLILQNLGQGRFRTAFRANESAMRLHVGDFNNDGLMDFAGSWGGPAIVYLNKGNFNFELSWTGPSYDGSWVEDFDRDGYLDYMGANGNGIFWFQNSGDGSRFYMQAVSGRGEYGDGGVAGDIDLDGLPDVGGTYEKVGWFKQLPDHTFQECEVGNFPNSHWIYIDNLDPGDCDSDIDILTGNDQLYVWWENKMIQRFASKGWLESSILDGGYLPAWSTAGWQICLPEGYIFRMRVRAGASVDELSNAQWSEPLAFSGDTLSKYGIENGNRYFQYRLEYERPVDTINPDKPLRVERVWVSYLEGAAGIIVEPDSILYAYPGDSVLFLPRVINPGSYADTVMLNSIASSSWRFELRDASNNRIIYNSDTLFVTSNNGTRTLRLRVVVPTQAHAGERDTIVIYGQSKVDTTLKDSAVYIVEAISIPEVQIWPDSEDSIYPGDSVDYHLWIRNNGNDEDVIELSLSGLSGGWGCSFYDVSGQPLTDSDGDQNIDIGRLGIGDSIEFIARIRSSQDASYGYTDYTNVFATSSIEDTVQDNVILITHIIGAPPDYAIIVEPDTGAVIHPGQTADYDVRVINASDVLDTVSLNLINGIWDYTLTARNGIVYRDFNNDGTADVILAAGDTGYFTLHVVPLDSTGLRITGPYDSLGQLYDEVVVLGSLFSDTLRDSAVIWTRVVPVFNVHNFPNPFNNETDFFYSLPEAGYVTLKIFDRAGQYVTTIMKNEHHEAGQYIYSRQVNNGNRWDRRNYKGKEVSEGVYFYAFTFVPDNTHSRKRKVIKKMIISR